MDTYLIVFALFLLCVLIILIGFLCYLGIKFTKREQEKQTEGFEKVAEKTIEKAHFCVDHPEELASGECSIDMELYCEKCLTKIDDIKIAKKNISEYSSFKWIEMFMMKNEQNFEDLLNRVRQIKKDLWEKKSMPLIIRRYYKIDVETDEIESFTALMCRENDETSLRKELSFIN